MSPAVALLGKACPPSPPRLLLQEEGSSSLGLRSQVQPTGAISVGTAAGSSTATGHLPARPTQRAAAAGLAVPPDALLHPCAGRAPPSAATVRALLSPNEPTTALKSRDTKGNPRPLLPPSESHAALPDRSKHPGASAPPSSVTPLGQVGPLRFCRETTPVFILNNNHYALREAALMLISQGHIQQQTPGYYHEKQAKKPNPGRSSHREQHLERLMFEEDKLPHTRQQGVRNPAGGTNSVTPTPLSPLPENGHRSSNSPSETRKCPNLYDQIFEMSLPNPGIQ